MAIKCCFTDCDRDAEHKHHVTYDPPVIKMLYREHHEDITIINGAKARGMRKKNYWRGDWYGRVQKLTNKQRWWIWYQWLEGKLKPRRTKKALDYIKDWDKFDSTETNNKSTGAENVALILGQDEPKVD